MAAVFDIILCDLQPDMVRAWKRAFVDYPEVEVAYGDLMEVEADAYVFPANSYGIMDGGIDADLKARFPGIEANVQDAISAFGLLLPVGKALVVETGDPYISYLFCAPTMEVPSRVGHTENAYLAMKAVLIAVETFNSENKGAITSIAIPGFCTGVGEMHVDDAASQMARAYADLIFP